MVSKGVYWLMRTIGAYYGIFNVRWYGAKCDATAASVGTDDTAAVQAARAAAELVNGMVWVPARCKTTSAITGSSSFSMSGPGAAPDTGSGAIGYAPRGQLISTSTSGNIVTVTGNSSTVAAHIENIALVGATAYGSHTAGAGIEFVNCISPFMSRVTVFNKYKGVVCSGSGTTWAPSFSDLEIALIKHTGLDISHGSTIGGFGHVGVRDCQITNANGTRMSNAAVRLNGVSGMTITNVDAIGAETGWMIGDSVKCIYLVFLNCLGDTCTLPWDVISCRLSDWTSCYAATIGGAYGVAFRANADDLTWLGGTMGYFSAGGFYFAANASNIDVVRVKFRTYSGGATGSPFVFAGSTDGITITWCKAKQAFDFTGAGCALGAHGHTNLIVTRNSFNAAITGTKIGTGNYVQDNWGDDL